VAYLEKVPDARKAQGKQYRWVSLLVIVCAGLLSGQKTVQGIGEWAQLHRQELIAGLGIRCKRIPHVSTLRRALQAVSVTELEGQVQAYSQPRAAAEQQSQAVVGCAGQWLVGEAVAGKAVCGANTHGAALHWVSRVQHGSGWVLNQCAADKKSNEITAAPTLLCQQDLQGKVITADALLCQREFATLIVQQGGDYLLVVKDNQHQLYQAIDLLFRELPLDCAPPRCHMLAAATKDMRVWSSVR